MMRWSGRGDDQSLSTLSMVGQANAWQLAGASLSARGGAGCPDRSGPRVLRIHQESYFIAPIGLRSTGTVTQGVLKTSLFSERLQCAAQFLSLFSI